MIEKSLNQIRFVIIFFKYKSILLLDFILSQQYCFFKLNTLIYCLVQLLIVVNSFSPVEKIGDDYY